MIRCDVEALIIGRPKGEGDRNCLAPAPGPWPGAVLACKCPKEGFDRMAYIFPAHDWLFPIDHDMF